jgi:AraC family transcriptional regulator, regulatory protein of adaptative response / methylated-DNA-[protein]-cysteine methyltransferase
MNAATDPFLDSRDFSRIARSIRYIDAHYRDQPRLAQIATDAGLSEFHFNRLFRRWAGLTPKQYLAFVTGNAAKAVLAERPSVLEAAFCVGLSGPGRLHDLVVSLEAMTPGELKLQGRGVLIRYGSSDTPFGRALIAVTDRGVCHLSFVEHGKESAALRALKERWPAAVLRQDDAQAGRTAERIWGSRGARLSVAVAGTNFQLKVWQALIDLGSRGATTYADIAAAIGSPTASRAVGNAVGANPVGWLIPCHQVLRRDGALGGYHWGADRKRAMLAWTALCHVPAPAGQGRVNRGLGT